jgi:hypothetical protein
MTSVSRQAFHGLVVKRPITSPCHGEDRRFESGRARQIVYSYLSSLINDK